MAVLGLIEGGLSFAAIYVVITAAGGSRNLSRFGAGLPHDAVALAATLTLFTGLIGVLIGLYRIDACLSRGRLLAASGLAVTVTFAIQATINSAPHNGHTVFIGEMLGAWLATLAVIRLTYGLMVRRVPLTRRVLLLGDPQQASAFGARLRSRRGGAFELITLSGGDLGWPMLRQHRIWGVIVASTPDESTVAALLDCKLRGMKIVSDAAFHENYLGRIDLDRLAGNDLLLGHGFAATWPARVFKRLADIVLGLFMLILALPLMILTAVAIKIDSRGPVFYRQQRTGQFDMPFTLFKFRSMTANAEAGGSPRWAQKHDPRITRVGRFIRATRIDELPQLANVIRGEMSLVGPRPERPHFVEQLARAIPFYRQRSYVKPGLTGWAQVDFPYGASVGDAREKLAYDLYYVKNRSVLLDVIILLSTIRVVLFREGAR